MTGRPSLRPAVEAVLLEHAGVGWGVTTKLVASAVGCDHHTARRHLFAMHRAGTVDLGRGRGGRHVWRITRPRDANASGRDTIGSVTSVAPD